MPSVPSISFAKSAADAAAPVKNNTPTADDCPPGACVPSAPAPTAVATVPPARRGLMLGDFLPDFGDVIFPRLNIAQAIGELGETFKPGTVVLNQELTLFQPAVLNKDGSIKEAGTPPVVVTCLGFRPTRFAEYVAGGGRGIIVDSEAEVRAHGGTTNYDEHKLKAASGLKKFDPMAEAVLAIERPEHTANDGTVFVYDVSGKQYALALWSMKRTAYTAAAKGVFFTRRAMGCLREGYPTYSFKLSTRWKSFGESNGAWVPVLIEPAKQPVEFLAWAQSVLNPAESLNSGAEEA